MIDVKSSKPQDHTLSSILGVWGCNDPQILGWWVLGGRRAGRWGGFVKHYYITLSCRPTGSMFESGGFSSEIE